MYPQKPQQEETVVYGQPVYGQPQQQQPVMINGQFLIPVQLGPPALPGPANWQTGICDCFQDCTICVEGWICGHCQQAAQYNMIVRGEPSIDYGVCCLTVFLDVFCKGIALAVLTMMNRQQLVRRYGIREDGCMTCLHSFFCLPCSTCQQHREMTMRGQFPGGVFTSSPSRILHPTQVPTGTVDNQQ